MQKIESLDQLFRLIHDNNITFYVEEHGMKRETNVIIIANFKFITVVNMMVAGELYFS